MSNAEHYIAEIILPLPVKGTFQYIISSKDIDIAQIGSRAIVQFGRKKIYTGIISAIFQSARPHSKLKEVLEIPDDEPIVNSFQLKLIEWMHKYYMCYPGEVLRAALPSGLKINSESRIELIDKNWENRSAELSDPEYNLLKYLSDKEQMSVAEVSALLDKINPGRFLKKLADEAFIAFFEEVVDRYRPKKIRKVRMKEDYNNSEIIEGLFEELSAREKQIDVLMLYLKESGILENPSNNSSGVPNVELVKQGASQSSINTLVKNGYLEFFDQRVSRFPEVKYEERVFNLSKNQSKALKEIKKEWETKGIVLLKGITGSGKTEIYIELIREAIEKGKQCLYLLPEIALTTHIVERLKKVFGNDIGVYHSRFSDNERVEIWENLNKEKYNLIVGVRSSLFLPFENLGLIIIDEEHDSSFKQHDPAPRYHARESAIILAQMHKAKVLLGSATPAMESNYLCEIGKWGKVELNERYHKDSSLPRVIFQNFREAKIKGLTKSIFTKQSLDALQKTLDDKKQAIVFQNRRGYSPYLQCMQCGYIPMCHQCDVSLVLHQYSRQLRCHYCGFYEEPPTRCPRCNHSHFQTMGTGTEKVEEELQVFFPDAGIQRMDLDTTRGKYAHQNILEAFDSGRIDFLVGTQMVTKGLDFDNVELVLVIGVDRLLFFPDFRATERTFQTITQVSGRAGRKSNQGKVMLQTNMPDHELFSFIHKNDYDGFYKWELAERNRFFYPPISRIIRLTLKSRDPGELENDSRLLAGMLIKELGSKRVLGPEEPPVARIRNLYIREIFIKYEREGIQPSAIKKLIEEQVKLYEKKKTAPNLRVIIDVDPV
ncbi:MAG: primosomal protein N' [Cytophagales bacterium]